MYEVLLGAGYGLKQLSNLVKELAGLKNTDKKIESEIDKLKASIKALQKKHDAMAKVQVHTSQELEAVKRNAKEMESDIEQLRSKAHGLKIQRGKAMAEINRLKQ